MFTGIIQEIGKIKKKIPTQEGLKLTISCSSELIREIKVDDSVAINGVCQTVTQFSEGEFSVDCVHTSLEKTTLGAQQMGDEVNLELALRPIDRLGGHFVQGHVNGTGKILEINSRGNNYIVWIQINNKSLEKYIVQEGSITLDGISLTLAEVKGDCFSVSIIPHTFEKTILKNKKIGHLVNIEIDVLIKYIESLIFKGQSLNHRKTNSPSNSNITLKWLMEKGF